MAQRDMAYRRNQLQRTVNRFREGRIDGEVLAKAVEWFLRETAHG